MKAAGLNIQGAKVKAAIVDIRFGSVRPIATDELLLPSDPAERDGAFKAALDKWKEAYGIAGVTVGLNLSHFSHRIIELPVHKKEDIQHALLFEMEKHLPLEPDQYSIDFHTIEKSKEGSRNLVLAIRKDKVKWVFNCLSEAGLAFLGLKCTALEATNELLTNVNVADALMLYPTADVFQVIGLKGAHPEYLKVVNTREAAIAEVERNLDSYGKTLFVAGEGSALEYDRFSPRSLPLNMPNILASPSGGKTRIKTNFVPAEYAAAKKDYYPYALVLLCAACVVIFFSTTILAYVKDYRALNWVNVRIEKLREETKDVIDTERKVTAAREKLKFLYEFQHRKNDTTRVLAELSGILPKTASLNSLSIDEQGKVEIEGSAYRAADIIQPLENSPLLKDVEFSSPVTVKEGAERFSLKMQIEKPSAEDR